ncbi:MAG: mRNA surveillance protein pelota [Candidatus Aenigmarchaeota archaeon]|nr:mRNA surveillance protein pelota [Candidatus Aenigmarchaeota archaeon]
MQLLTTVPKQGTMQIRITSADDMWHLSQIIAPNDVLTAQTERKIKIGEEKAAITRRKVILSICVEKVECSPHFLRVSGKIIEGKEDIPAGSYHTINLEEGSAFNLTKEQWPRYQLERLKEAAQEKMLPTIIVLFDREEAFIALLKRTGAEFLSHLRGEVPKKRMQTKSKVSFYQTILEGIKEYDKRFKLQTIILASPSFWKEELLKELKDAELKKKMILVSCSSVDENAINEVISSPQTKNALTASRTAHEMQAVDSLLAEIKKDSKLAVYGLKEVHSATEAGAVRQLLITDAFIVANQEKGTYAEIDMFLRKVDNSGGTITVVCADHAGGKKLAGLGNIAALLRYSI